MSSLRPLHTAQFQQDHSDSADSTNAEMSTESGLGFNIQICIYGLILILTWMSARSLPYVVDSVPCRRQ